MANISFFKYQGAGNDFILVDEYQLATPTVNWTPTLIAQLCDRRFGIGADGLMRLRAHDSYDFEMCYYNSDGHASTMCGNGGRCIAAFAHRLGYVGKEMTFLAVDGPHRAKITRENWVELEMHDVEHVQRFGDDYFVDTGSPHYLHWVGDLATVDVQQAGASIRYSDAFQPGGTNVNFVRGDHRQLELRTYERGVEGETLACGTGVTAAALVAITKAGKSGAFSVPVQAQGGELAVRTNYQNGVFQDIWLCGPAEFVFQGEIKL